MDKTTVIIGVAVLLAGLVIYLIGESAVVSIPVEFGWWIFKTTTTTSFRGNPSIMLIGLVVIIIGIIVLVYGLIRKETKKKSE
jgi:hypothetical protein